jgi:sugar phosphate permease
MNDDALDEIPGTLPSGVVRYQVLACFAALASITYLDRICMAQAAGPISETLGLDKRQMGLVFSAFTLAYMLFEVPTGWLGDRIGPRRVLVRVVLWWSLFTALTGWAPGLWSMLAVRLAFGAGEAGAFPNIARALTRWFPTDQRGRAQGVVWTTARLGGAIAPPLTAAIMSAVGWRATFVLYGLLGLVWAGFFWSWYRDEPAEHPSITLDELRWLKARLGGGAEPATREAAPWGRILGNPSVWGLAGSTCCVSFAWFFNATWLPTYLEEARGLDLNRASWYASLPFVFGVVGCALGGWISDRLVVTLGGPKWARRVVGFSGSILAGVCFLLSLRVDSAGEAILLMALSAFFNDLTLSSLWAASMDIGERDAGRVAGVMNTASGLGGFLSPIVFGELLNRNVGWTTALTLAGAAFLVGGVFWLLVDPTRTVASTDMDEDPLSEENGPNE